MADRPTDQQARPRPAGAPVQRPAGARREGEAPAPAPDRGASGSGSTTPAARPAGRGTGAPAPAGSPAPTPAAARGRGPAPTPAPTGRSAAARDDDGDDTSKTTKIPLTERISAMVSGAADEHRANSRAGARADSRSEATPRPATSARKPPRRARLRLVRVDPWTVMKTAFLLAIALGIVTVVSVAIVWTVLGAAGVWESINATVADVVGTDETSGFDVRDYVGMSRILGFTVLVSAINVVLLTAIATLGAFLYNMAAALLGGIEVTLAEDER